MTEDPTIVLIATITRLRGQIADAEDENAQHRAELRDLYAQVDDLQGDVRALEDQLKTVSHAR